MECCAGAVRVPGLCWCCACQCEVPVHESGLHELVLCGARAVRASELEKWTWVLVWDMHGCWWMHVFVYSACVPYLFLILLFYFD